MENSSPSPTLPGSQIKFAPDAFAPGWSVLAFIGMLLVVAVAAIVAILVYLIAQHGNLAALTRQSVPVAIITQGIIDLCVAGYLFRVLPRIARASLRDLGFRVPRATDVGVAIAGAIAMVVVVNGLGTIIDAASGGHHQQQQIKIFLNITDPRVKLGFALLACIVAPLAEELAFRVFVFNAVRRYWGFWTGAVVSGIFFGLAHMDIYALVPLVFGGIILCTVYARTGNAWMSMITHAIFNGVSLAVLYIAPNLAK